MRRAIYVTVVGLLLVAITRPMMVIASGTQAAQSRGCSGADVWWGESFARYLRYADVMTALIHRYSGASLEPGDGIRAAALIAPIMKQQQDDAPPPAGNQLQADLLARYQRGLTAANDLSSLVSHDSRNLPSMMRAGQAKRVDDEVTTVVRDIIIRNPLANQFVSECRPVVVVVNSPDGRFPVYPGDTTPLAQYVTCPYFRDQADAQRFADADGPGGISLLDADGNGYACDEPGIVFTGQP